ncbi:hypothetical protein CR513_12648, partial [Mucuna pruriens]
MVQISNSVPVYKAKPRPAKGIFVITHRSYANVHPHSTPPYILVQVQLPSTSFLNAVTWTVFLMFTVVLVSLASGVAFLLAVSPSSSFSKPCQHHGVGHFVRVPLDFPREMVCLPERAVMSRSHFDFFLPTLFAALVVGASTCLLRLVACA